MSSEDPNQPPRQNANGPPYSYENLPGAKKKSSKSKAVDNPFSSNASGSAPKPLNPSRTDSQSSTTSGGGGNKTSKTSGTNSQPASRDSSKAPTRDKGKQTAISSASDSGGAGHVAKGVQDLSLADDPRGRGTGGERGNSSGRRQDSGGSKDRGSVAPANDVPERSRAVADQLPPELMKEVYKYLFEPQIIEYTQPRTYTPPIDDIPGQHSKSYHENFGRANSYKLDLSLLFVNKATYEFSKEELKDRSATTVAVQFNIPAFQKMVHLCNIPIKTDLGGEAAKAYNAHAVHVNLEWASTPLLRVYQNEGHELPQNSGKLLMLVRDFPKLCEMLKFMCQYPVPGCAYVVTKVGPAIRVSKTPPREMLTMKVSIRPEQLKPSQQTKILADIQKIIGAGYNLAITGASNDLVLRMQERMAPRLVWVPALLWDQVDSIMHLKPYADDLAKKRDFHAAWERYSFIANHLAEGRNQREAEWLGSATPDPDRLRANQRLALLYFDLHMSMGATTLRIRTPECQEEAWTYIGIKHAPESAWYTDKMHCRLRLFSVQSWLAKMVVEGDISLSDNMPVIRTQYMKFIDSYYRSNPGSTLDEYLMHDYHVFKRESEKATRVTTDQSAFDME